MASAVFRFEIEGGSELARALGKVREAATREQQTIAGGERSMFRGMQRDHDSHVKAFEKAEKERTRAALRELTERRRAEERSQKQVSDALKEATRLAARESKDRIRDAKDEAREIEKLANLQLRAKQEADRQATREAAAEEQKRTREAQRQGRIRIQHAQQEAREEAAAHAQARQTAGGWGRSIAGGIWGAASSFASNLHGQFQSAREERAAQESAMNTFLIQRGATRDENAAARLRIRQFAEAHHMNMTPVIEAIGTAQESKNALGGATAEARSTSLNQTLQDVEFAHIIDPNNMGGLTTFSAMLRQQGVSGPLRQQMLRSIAGQSFTGSVAAQGALRSGLPGMMQQVSTMTANAPAADRERITQEVITDFYAQLQTVANTGGTVGVTSNRIGTLRTALNNANTQNDLGAALNARQMTAEQRAEFGRSFTRDRRGNWTMNQALANSPSEAAAFFGHQFNNDATAVSNFLGKRGGNIHAETQMLTKPAAQLLTSYFATAPDEHGNQVRQYDAVKALRQATITPEQEQEMRKTRAEEDINNLNDNKNKNQDALTDNTSKLVQVSNWLQALVSRSPVAAAGVSAAGGIAGGLAGGVAGALGVKMLTGAAAAAETGAAAEAGGGIMGLLTAAGLGTVAAVTAAGAAGLGAGDLAQRKLTDQHGYAEGNAESVFNSNTWTVLFRGIVDAVKDGMNGATVNVSPHDAAHAANANSTKPR